MSRTKHHGNSSKDGKDLWGKRGGIAGRSYSKYNRKQATRRVRQAKRSDLAIQNVTGE